jgi:glycosyltransferase involved in cell wall biosynthesis
VSEAPFVSFVFPVHAGGLELARRSIDALEAQTDQDFEVIVAIDAPQSSVSRYESAIRPWVIGRSFPGQTVQSLRPVGLRDLPHRNHARNAGCRAARGEYLWPLDADIIAHPRAVEHLKAIVSRFSRPVAVSPCFAQPECSPAEWLAERSPRTAEDIDAIARKYAFKTWTSSGHFKNFRPGSPASIHFPQLIEGQPAFPRRVWEALGGFSEKFTGYGGNKVSFVRALTLLDSQEGVLSTQLMTSCVFVHQPHELDPLRDDRAHRDSNWQLFNAHVSEMRSRAPWWCKAVEALRE